MTIALHGRDADDTFLTYGAYPSRPWPCGARTFTGFLSQIAVMLSSVFVLVFAMGTWEASTLTAQLRFGVLTVLATTVTFGIYRMLRSPIREGLRRYGDVEDVHVFRADFQTCSDGTPELTLLRVAETKEWEHRNTTDFLRFRGRHVTDHQPNMVHVKGWKEQCACHACTLNSLGPLTGGTVLEQLVADASAAFTAWENGDAWDGPTAPELRVNGELVYRPDRTGYFPVTPENPDTRFFVSHTSIPGTRKHFHSS